MRTHRALVLAGLLVLACDSKDGEKAEAGEKAETGEHAGDGDGDGDGDAPASCLDHTDADACEAAECMWGPAMRSTTADEACTVRQLHAVRERCWRSSPGMQLRVLQLVPATAYVTPEVESPVYPMCIPPSSDGGDPACVVSIPGCPELVEGAEGPFQPAWIEHPEGGWVVIDLCGNLEYDSFTKCTSGVGDAHPACDCACSG